MSGGTEESIFDSIEASTGDDFGGGAVEGEQPGAPSPDLEQDQVEQQLARREKAPQEPPPGKPEQQKAPLRTTPNGKPITENVRQAEQRTNQTISHLRQANQDLQQRLTDYGRRIAENGALNQLPQQFGLQNQEVIEGLQFIVDLKSNPVAAAQKMIQAALARGANLREIVNDEMVPNISLRATQQLLDERLGPIQQQNQERARQEQVQSEAVKGANQFLVDYPEALPHQADIAQLMGAITQDYQSRGIQVHPAVAAEKAWERIQSFAQQNNFDLNQPLGPQYQARNQGPAPAQRTSHPMPNGVSNGGAPMISRSARPSKVSDSYDSIVREAMRESGIPIN